jgi:hypothetical protein
MTKEILKDNICPFFLPILKKNHLEEQKLSQEKSKFDHGFLLFLENI